MTFTLRVLLALALTALVFLAIHLTGGLEARLDPPWDEDPGNMAPSDAAGRP